RLASLEREPDAGDATAPVEPPPPPAVEPAPPASANTPTPTLAPAPAPTPALAPAPAPAHDGSSWKTVGFVVGGAGVTSVGASLVLGALALVKNHDADAICSGKGCHSP